ncbi:MAG: biosynthesis protein [Massilia sp.]|nr:biosynthesis protein [Massilia sp.]
MNESQTFAVEPEIGSAGITLGWVDVLIVLAKHKKLIVGLPVAVATVAAAISFILPPAYRANTQLLPPQQPQSGAAALLSQLGGAAAAVAGGATIKSPNDLYIGMLRSRTIADKLIEKYDLRKVYGTNSPEEARRELAGNTSISSGKDGLISIEVEDADKQRVARLANSYVEELLKLTSVLAVTEASQRRVFFERQLDNTRKNLATAEAELKHAIDTRGIISVETESRAMVETIGRLRAEISAKEIQLGAMRAFVTTRNQDYLQGQEQLTSLRAELSRLQNGSGASADAPRNSGGKAGLENIKIVREVKYHQMLYELLAKQYEAARLDEAKDSPIVQVLDPAMEPERHAKPRRALIILVSAVLAFIAALGIAFVRGLKEKLLTNPVGESKWREFKSRLRMR